MCQALYWLYCIAGICIDDAKSDSNVAVDAEHPSNNWSIIFSEIYHFFFVYVIMISQCLRWQQ